MDQPAPATPSLPAAGNPTRCALLAGLGTAGLGLALVTVGLQAFEGLRQRMAWEASRYRAGVLSHHLSTDIGFSEQIHRLGGRPADVHTLWLQPQGAGQPRLRHPTWQVGEHRQPQLLVPLGDRSTLLVLQPTDMVELVLAGASPDMLRQFSVGLRTLPAERLIGGDPLSFQLEGVARRTIRLRGTPILELAIAPRPLPLSAYAVPLLLVVALGGAGATTGLFLSRCRVRQQQQQLELRQDQASLLRLTRAQPFRLPLRPEGPAMQAYFASGQALLPPDLCPEGLHSGSSRRLFDRVLAGVHPEDRPRLHLPAETSLQTPDAVSRPWSVQVRLRQPDGSWRWHELRAQLVAQAPLEILQGVLLDVDEQVRAQQGCSLQVDLLELIASQSGVWPYRMPLPNEGLQAPTPTVEDPAALLLPQVDPQLLALGRHDLALQALQGQVHPQDLPILERHYRRLRQAPLHSRQECTYRLRLPGQTSWLTVLDRAEVVQNLPRPVVQGVLLDLDEQERLLTHERQLWTRIQTTQATLDVITRLGGLFFLDYPLLAWQDPQRCDADDFTLSCTSLEFLELPVGASLQDWMQRLQERIHPADLPRAQAHYGRLPADPGQTRELRFRMRLPQGGYTTILCRSHLRQTERGWRIQGVGLDLGGLERSSEPAAPPQLLPLSDSG